VKTTRDRPSIDTIIQNSD